jgi:hypothetical protein
MRVSRSRSAQDARPGVQISGYRVSRQLDAEQHNFRIAPLEARTLPQAANKCV